jgi:hypothetical protein
MWQVKLIKLKNMSNYKLDANAGSQLSVVVKKAKEKSKELNQVVEFDFNGVKILVNENTNEENLFKSFHASFLMDWKEIGPDYPPVFEPEVLEELQKRRQIQKEKQVKADAEYQEKMTLSKLAFEEKVFGLEMEFKDKEGWDEWKSKQTDDVGYGLAVFDFAESWAKLMQYEMSKGKTLLECAKKTSFSLDFLGITGFMYGAAVQVLNQTWKYGDELKEVLDKERAK